VSVEIATAHLSLPTTRATTGLEVEDDNGWMIRSKVQDQLGHDLLKTPRLL
jgi:hypothetical protein